MDLEKKIYKEQAHLCLKEEINATAQFHMTQQVSHKQPSVFSTEGNVTLFSSWIAKKTRPKFL